MCRTKGVDDTTQVGTSLFILYTPVFSVIETWGHVQPCYGLKGCQFIKEVNLFKYMVIY
jgi:hypothetical protein